MIRFIWCKIIVGRNIFYEEVKTYTINVTRKYVDKPANNEPTNNTPTSEEVKKSNNNYLSELKLSNGTLFFDNEKTEYKVTVAYNIEKIEVTTKTEDGTTTIYKINVEKVNTKNVVIISVMVFLLVTLVVLSVILVKSRKKQTF